MNLLDIILIVSIGYGIFHGYKNGLLRMLSVGAGVIAGLLQTIVFMPRFTKYIQNATGWETTTSMIISFFLIMIVSVTIFYVAARLLTQLLRLININFINQIFGAVFSGYIAMLIVTAAIDVSGVIWENNSYTGKKAQDDSLFYKETTNLTSLLIEEAKK